MTAPAFATETPAATGHSSDVEAFDESSPATDTPVPGGAPATPETKVPPKKTAGKKAKTLTLTLTVTGTADGEWHAEVKQGNAYVVRNVAVTAAAVSRAAKELHQELFAPIEALMDEARSQQAARVAELEAELEAARKVLADLD